MQRTEYNPESPLKSLYSLPSLLAIVAMLGFYFTISHPDQSVLSGTAQDNPGANSRAVLDAACALKPYKLMKSGKLVEAVKAADTLLEANPHDVAVIYCAAIVLNKSGSKNDAFALMKKALALAPRNLDLRQEYARMLVGTGKLDDAVAQYKRLIEQSPKRISPHRELAELYLNSGKPAESAHELQELLKYSPNDGSAHKICGIALARAGKAQEGMDEYLAGIASEHGAGQPEAVKLILGSFNNLDKGKFELEQDAAQHPDDAMPKLRLAQLALYADHPDEAKQYLLDARKLAPNNFEIHRSLCVAYKRLGDNRQALIAFMQSVALEQEQNKMKPNQKPAK